MHDASSSSRSRLIDRISLRGRQTTHRKTDRREGRVVDCITSCCCFPVQTAYLDHGTFGAAHHDVPVERRDDPVRGPRHEREHLDVRVDLEAGDLEDHGHGEDDADRDDVEVAEFLENENNEQLFLSVRSNLLIAEVKQFFF